jgi:hypothetical protein
MHAFVHEAADDIVDILEVPQSYFLSCASFFEDVVQSLLLQVSGFKLMERLSAAGKVKVLFGFVDKSLPTGLLSLVLFEFLLVLFNETAQLLVCLFCDLELLL